MSMTKEEFKRRWEKDDQGDGITLDEIAACAEAWGLFAAPKVHPIPEVVEAVLKAADTTAEATA